jgi:putative transposase
MSVQSAKNVLAGIELMHLIRNDQRNLKDSDAMSFAEQFYARAGQLRPA